ncbi:FHA domain-containing protein [uncultured Desulfosarcina sp.]|uniref:FHA domain-containing protein n=1 Tax=uncultured Desulfosarcina sp. TaxID=218289 RepID=UPI0029C5FEEA|nr:FHA domain-containing protein [uncultured Desulfosarcina sp.]
MIAFSPDVLRITLADGTTFSFRQGFAIGRHSTCGICIRDGVVSPRHADVVWENGSWRIQDLQSANGVFLNGQRIQPAVLARRGAFNWGQVDRPCFSTSKRR